MLVSRPLPIAGYDGSLCLSSMGLLNGGGGARQSMNNRRGGSLGTIWESGTQLLQGSTVALILWWAFSILTLLTFGAGKSFVVWGCLVYYKMFSNISGSTH